MYSVIVPEITNWIRTLCGHVVVYVGLTLEDDSGINKKYECEEDRIYRKLNSHYSLDMKDKYEVENDSPQSC